MHKVSLSKFDVAKRELDFAIRLFFNGGDFVVTHLVISACQDILESIGGSEKSMRLDLINSVKKEKRSYVRKKLKHYYNFFKHADRDAKSLLEFQPESTQYAMIDAIGMYQSISGEITGLMMSFRLWFYIKNPDILMEAEQKKLFDNLNVEIDVNNKQLFIDLAAQYEIKRTGT